MKVPISWIKDFVDISLPMEELVERLTLAGLEVEEIRFVGLPILDIPGYKVSGFAWDRDKLVVAELLEVLPHPDPAAAHLVLCKLNIGPQMLTTLTAAPNVRTFIGQGKLKKPVKVAAALAGAQVYENQKASEVIVTIEQKTILGVESASMLCSEKELGISCENEGVIFLDKDATVGMPLADYMGDVVLNIAITPNMIRNANVLGLAREISALSGQPLRLPEYTYPAEGRSIKGMVSVEIRNPELNPRFMLGLVQDVEIKPSPYWVQRRLRLSEMSVINNVVDATNYVMLEIGEPLHAFDYDTLVARAQNQAPTIITRTALTGESLTTLDGITRPLDPFTVLVCDQAGSLSLAGIIGGAESEVHEPTKIIGTPKIGSEVGIKGVCLGEFWEASKFVVLEVKNQENSPSQFDMVGNVVNLTDEGCLITVSSSRDGNVLPGQNVTIHFICRATNDILIEGAAWNFINIRKTLKAQAKVKLIESAASYQFARDIHPAMAEKGVRRCLRLIQQWSSGKVAQGLIDNYPVPLQPILIEITPAEVRRWVDIKLSAREIGDILTRLEFQVKIKGQYIRAIVPDHRMDLGNGMVGKAGIVEEIARIYGYNRIPEVRLREELPPRLHLPELEWEDRIRDILVGLNIQEAISYRLTTPEREQLLIPRTLKAEPPAYARLVNPKTVDRTVLRRSLLASVMDVMEHNFHNQEHIAFFEVGSIYCPSNQNLLPEELPRLAIAISGARSLPNWQDGLEAHPALMDFYDLKAIVEALLDGLHISKGIRYETAQHPTFHPGKNADIFIGDQRLGSLGELHPLVMENYQVPPGMAIYAVELDIKALMNGIPDYYAIQPVPSAPPVLEDLSIIVNEDIPSSKVIEVIQAAGNTLIRSVRLLDVYRKEQFGKERKSLTYRLTYQNLSQTLTNENVALVRQQIIQQLEQKLGAILRG